MDSNQANTVITTFGVASCFGGSQETCANAPDVIRTSAFNEYLSHKNLELSWKTINSPLHCPANSLNCLRQMSQQIATLTYQYTLEHINNNRVEQPFLLISGEHSSAVGTWSGVMQASETKKIGRASCRERV